MSGTIFRDICVGTVVVYSLIAVLLPTLSTAIPLKMSERKRKPWSTPCNPSGYSLTVDSKNENSFIEYVVEKSEESYYHSEYIESIMKERFNDPQIIEFFQRKHLEGFPKPAASEIKQPINATKLLIDNYNQLSRAAVFLEYIYENEIDNEVKFELETLFFGHLSQMCEIQLTFFNKGVSHEFFVADRSIMPENYHRNKSTFDRYATDIVIILKYRKLLNYQMTLYQKEMCF